MNPVLAKIKKLLRLAKDGGATPAEAATALSKAMALASEHGIDLQAVSTEEEFSSHMSHVTQASQCGPAHKMASWLVREHFGVETLFDSRSKPHVIHFIGVESNCHLADYAYTYLVRSMRTAWRNRTNRRLRDREAFLKGYAYAIHSLMPETFHRPGLVVCAKEYKERVIIAGRGTQTTIKPVKASSVKALDAGWQAGKKGGIRNAIRGSSQLNLPM